MVGSYSSEMAPKAFSIIPFLLISITSDSVGSLNLRMSHHNTWKRKMCMFVSLSLAIVTQVMSFHKVQVMFICDVRWTIYHPVTSHHTGDFCYGF